MAYVGDTEAAGSGRVRGAMGVVLFDAVLFDLDGTLVATERFWVAAAARGAERAFAELGLRRELPTAAEWLSMVGLPLASGFELVFSDLDAALRERVMARCVEEEEAALRAGGAAPLPGALEALRELRARGLALGIASNCSAGYLESMLRDLRLGELVDDARCLHSPLVRDKADMLAQLLERFGTRSAVMVGDRASDAAAAHINGLPHVHLASGFAPQHERVDAEAVIAHMGELVALLEGRARALEALLGELGALERRARAATIGVTGRSGSGKTLFARDAARLCRALDRPATALSLDAFLLPARNAPPPPDPHADHLSRAWDLAQLEAAVLAPRERGEATAPGPWGPAVAPDELLFLEGLFLADPRLAPRLGRLLHLEVPSATLQTRIRAREREPEACERFLERYLPAQAAFEARHPPSAGARVLSGANPLAPGT